MERVSKRALNDVDLKHAAVSRVGKAVAIALLLGVALAGCSTMKGWFSGKHGADKPLKPAELADITPTITVTRLWSANAGKGEGRIGVRQAPGIADGHVYAAAIKGGVRAFDLQTGAPLWHFDSDLPLSGGPGAGDGLVVVGSLEGDVVALDAATGAQKWTAKVSNEVIAAPVIDRKELLCISTKIIGHDVQRQDFRALVVQFAVRQQIIFEVIIAVVLRLWRVRKGRGCAPGTRDVSHRTYPLMGARSL